MPLTSPLKKDGVVVQLRPSGSFRRPVSQHANSATLGAVHSIGDYSVRGEIARGGMGIVYRAARPGDSTEVAIKVLLQTASAKPIAVARFHRETRAMLAVDHPHVVRLLDTGEHHGRPFLVMDLVEGESLQDRIAREGPLDPRFAAQIAAKLARALTAIHEQGIIHRDVKPENVILTPAGEPLLTDFGIAKALDSNSHLSKTGTFMGSPGYWPPEQVKGKLDLIGPASDVYTLGGTLYALLTSHPPVQAETLVECLQQTCDVSAKRPSDENPAVPRELDRIVLKCLEKRIEDRYPTADALENDLNAFVDGRHAPSRLPGLTALALTLVALGAGLATIYGSARDAVPAPPPTSPANADAAVAPTVTTESPPSSEAPAPKPTRPQNLLPLEPGLNLAWRRRGQARLETGEYAKGLADLERALELDPNDIPARFAAAMCRAHLNDPGLALAGFNQVLARDVTHVDSYLNRGLLFATLGLPGLARRSFDQALQVFPRTDPRREEIKARLAEVPPQTEGPGAAQRERRSKASNVLPKSALLASLPTDRALSLCNSALAIDPTWAKAYADRGQIRHKRREHDLALLDYSRSLVFNPKNGRVYNLRGLTFLSTNKLHAAIKSFTKALDRPGRRGRYLQHRGWTYSRLGQHRKALSDFQSALEIAKTQTGPRRAEVATDIDRAEQAIQALGPRPKTAAEFLKKGNELKQQGAFSPAISELSEAIWRDPTLWRALYKRGRCYVELEEHQKALRDLDQALKVGPPEQPWTHYARGRALAQLQDDAGAIKAYTRSIALNPKLFPAIYRRGRARMRTNDKVGAVTDFGRALEVAPEIEHATILYHRAKVHASESRFDEALVDLDRCLDLDAKNVDARVWRGIVRSRKSDPEGAVADLRHGLDLVSPDDPRHTQIEDYLRELNDD